MKEYTVRKIGNTIFVFNTKDRTLDDKGNHRSANFKGTGMACCGVLQKGESLTAWLRKIKKARDEREERDVQPKKRKYVKKKVNADRARSN